MSGAGSPRISFEREALAAIEGALAASSDVRVSRGMGATNRFGIPSWELPILQHFQFGDLRLETDRAVVIVEVESGGGITNLVKYWPLLATASLGRQFVLAHIFRVTSAGDYAAHRRLWEYLVERMREDLESSAGLRWPDDWEARIFTYRSVDEMDGAVSFVREALA